MARLFQLKDEKYRLVTDPSKIIVWTKLYSEYRPAAQNQDMRVEYTVNERYYNLKLSGYYKFIRETERLRKLDNGGDGVEAPFGRFNKNTKKSVKKSVKKRAKKTVKKRAKKTVKKSRKKSS